MGFAELLVIALVALVVVGPDKLPQAIKTTLIWFGRIKRLISETRSEFEQQLSMDDIRRQIHNEEVLESLKALKAAKQAAEQEAGDVSDQVAVTERLIKEDFEPDDEGLFGDQQANHPPAETDNPTAHPDARQN